MSVLFYAGVMLIHLMQNPDQVTHEPTPATPMSKSFEASCRNLTVRIDGYGGPTRPREARPAIFVNGNRATGPGVEQLEEELARTRGVYRLAGLCSHGEPAVMQLQIHFGEADAQGMVTYAAGTAYFREGRLVHYEPFEPIDEGSFWFR